MKALLPLLLLAAPLAHADTAPDITMTLSETGSGFVMYRHHCTGADYAGAKADAIKELVEKANIACGSNVRQLTALAEDNQCQNFVGGEIQETATFGCVRRPDDSRNVVLSASYFMAVSFYHDILENGFNSQGLTAFDKAATDRCGGKYVRVRPYLVGAKIDPSLPTDKQLEVITTSQVYCGVENELLKN